MNDFEVIEEINYKPIKEVKTYTPSFDVIDNGIQVSSGMIDEKVEFSSNVQDNAAQSMCVTALDVAAYILGRIERCTTMKLHKLLYYCQAWSLVWDESPLFSDKIEAWANGPVIRRLFVYHKGLYEVTADDFSLGNPQLLNQSQRDTVNSVLEFYGDKSAQWLINLTHNEMPWINARKGLDPSERGNVEIKLSDMAEYYSAL